MRKALAGPASSSRALAAHRQQSEVRDSTTRLAAHCVSV
jgi:hypothetical protein